MSSQLGEIFRIATFGESHGGGVGVVLDGCPPRLPIAVEEIQRELRFQYVLGYYPGRREAESGRFRRIRLSTPRARHTVRARTGYYP